MGSGSYGNLRKSGKNQDLGSGGGVWGAFFAVNCKKKVARKLHGIILLHFGLIIFRIHFWKTRKPFIFMIFRFSDVTMSPKTNYFKVWRHQTTHNSSRKNSESFLKNVVWGNLKRFGHMKFWKLRKVGVESSWRFVLQNREHLEYVYLPKNMNWKMW